MEDFICRQDVFDLIDNWDSDMMDRRAFRCDVEDIPDVDVRKHGCGKGWIPGSGYIICSNCGYLEFIGIRKELIEKELKAFYHGQELDHFRVPKFCTECGADMREAG